MKQNYSRYGQDWLWSIQTVCEDGLRIETEERDYEILVR